MGPLLIELVQEAVKAILLLQAVEPRWPGRLFFEGEVHALVAAILLRMTGLMRSIAIPSRSHHTDSFERLNKALGLAKGTPLSERMASGRPRSRNRRSKAVIAGSWRVESSASQSNRKREAWSLTVKGKQ